MQNSFLSPGLVGKGKGRGVGERKLQKLQHFSRAPTPRSKARQAPALI